PMILGPDGAKLSKRHGAVSVLEYQEQGFLPDALLNYLVRLGWSHGDQEIFTLDEMVRLFEVTDVHTSAASVNPDKLLWLNQHYIKTSDPQHVAHHLSYHFGKLGVDPTKGPELAEVVKVQRERAKTLVEMAQNSVFFYREPDKYDDKAVAKNLKPELRPALVALREALAQTSEWTPPALHAAVENAAKAHGLEFGKIAQALRVALTGRAVSPPIDVTLHLVGRERSLARIAAVLEHPALK
ncbi:MAG: glutamate--tRNA ligase, partial [Sulfurifustaceae bacterium]